MKRILFAFVFASSCWLYVGGSIVAQQHAAPASTAGGNANTQASSNADVQATAKDALRKDLQGITDRVHELEIDAAKSAKSSREGDITTAIIAGFAALIATLIGGGMTLLGQHITAKRERVRENAAANLQLELARKQAVFKNTERILEYRLKQMELFYAPMFAHLNQSHALYKKLNHQLAQDDPHRFKLLSEPDPEGYILHVLANDGKWKGFRLLDQLPGVRKYPKSFALVERILQIGESMTNIISEHAGLASADSIDLLGEYLAHFAIISTIHKSGETEPYEPGWHKMGYYPRPLNAKIEAGYRELSNFLDEYSKASKDMLTELPPLGSSAHPEPQ